jgi:hypothetical protein
LLTEALFDPDQSWPAWGRELQLGRDQLAHDGGRLEPGISLAELDAGLRRFIVGEYRHTPHSATTCPFDIYQNGFPSDH